jgi:hypothetical protein
MLIEIGINAFETAALLKGLGLMMSIGIGGADGIGIACSCVQQHFLQMRAPT